MYSRSASQATELALERPGLPRTVAQDRGGHHDHVGANGERLHGISSAMDPRGCCQAARRTQLRPEDRQPPERQAQLRGVGERDPGRHVERVQVNVRLVEAVEQHQAVRPRLHDLTGEVREGRVVGRELDGERDRDRRPDLGDEVDVGLLAPRRPDQRIGCDVVQVELQRVGAGVLHQARVPDPCAARVGVEAGDDRDRDALLGLLDPLEIALPDTLELGDVGEVVERLGELLRALVEGAGQLDLVVEDLLLEQRGQDDGPDARVLELLHERRVAGQRRGGRDDGGSQVQPQVSGPKIGGHASVPFSALLPFVSLPVTAGTGSVPSSGTGRCGTLRCMPASCW